LTRRLELRKLWQLLIMIKRPFSKAKLRRGFNIISRGQLIITRGNEIKSWGFKIISRRHNNRGHKIIIRGHEILSWGLKIISCDHKIISRGHKKIIRGNEIMFWGLKIIRCGHRIISSSHKIIHIKKQSSIGSIKNITWKLQTAGLIESAHGG
jgi:hypothetical protein